jgi:hypothetical protein
MTAPQLRHLAAQLDRQGAHDLARDARTRASEREAGEPTPSFSALLIPVMESYDEQEAA